MQVHVEPGKYVVAVSGGVDSVVLLDLLADRPDLELVVAHFDHGIRPDSREDRELVATLSQKYGLVFEFDEGRLGSDVNENDARRARYAFLQQIRNKYQATGVITAHHKDDAVETLAFNVLRGTRRKGMSSLSSTDGIIRPLLPYSKQQIRDYAKENKLQWREDSTNSEEKYTRNWIRRKLLPRLSTSQKQELIESYEIARDRNRLLDEVVKQQLADIEVGGGLDRKKFVALPFAAACEVMAEWLRQHGIKFDRRLVETVVVSVKTFAPGKRVSLGRGRFLLITQEQVLEK